MPLNSKVGRERRIEEMLIDGAHISMSHPTFQVLKLNKNKDELILHNQTRDGTISSFKTEIDPSHLILSPNQTDPLEDHVGSKLRY